MHCSAPSGPLRWMDRAFSAGCACCCLAAVRATSGCCLPLLPGTRITAHRGTPVAATRRLRADRTLHTCCAFRWRRSYATSFRTTCVSLLYTLLLPPLLPDDGVSRLHRLVDCCAPPRTHLCLRTYAAARDICVATLLLSRAARLPADVCALTFIRRNITAHTRHSAREEESRLNCCYSVEQLRGNMHWLNC